LNKKQNSKKNAGGTTTLITNAFKYTTEMKKVEFFKWKETVFGGQVR
jgi:hypothetical protein